MVTCLDVYGTCTSWPEASSGGYLRWSSFSNSIVSCMLSMISRSSAEPELPDRISSRCTFVMRQNSYASRCSICHSSGKIPKVALGPEVASLRMRLNQANLRFVFSRDESGFPGANGSS